MKEQIKKMILDIIYEITGKKILNVETPLFSMDHSITPIEMTYVMLELEKRTGVPIRTLLTEEDEEFTIDRLAEKAANAPGLFLC